MGVTDEQRAVDRVNQQPADRDVRSLGDQVVGDIGGDGAIADQVDRFAVEPDEDRCIHDQLHLDIGRVGAGQARGAFDKGLAHDLPDRTVVARGAQATSPPVECVERREDLLGRSADMQDGDAVRVAEHRHSLVGTVANCADPGGIGVDADHCPCRGPRSLHMGQPRQDRRDLAIQDHEVIAVQACGLVDHSPCGLLADLAGLEQVEHLRQPLQTQGESDLGAGRSRTDVAGHRDLADHRQRGITPPDAHHGGPLSMQRRDLLGLLCGDRSPEPVQGGDRIDPVGATFVDRIGPEVMSANIAEDVLCIDLGEHTSNLRGPSDTPD
ncbi:hypothetical protein [Aeromicrobium sp.]|uniref:hypothetical protein n=1 Tax=Aeromicrobium sp. TaxID=1871063 RepID=UPI0030C1F524